MRWAEVQGAPKSNERHPPVPRRLLSVIVLASLLALACSGTALAAPTWLEPKNLSEKGFGAFSPRVGFDGNGQAVTSWFGATDTTGDTTQISERPRAGEWSAVKNLQVDGTNTPDLAVSANGTAVVAWEFDDVPESPDGSYIEAGVRTNGVWSSAAPLPKDPTPAAVLLLPARGDRLGGRRARCLAGVLLAGRQKNVLPQRRRIRGQGLGADGRRRLEYAEGCDHRYDRKREEALRRDQPVRRYRRCLGGHERQRRSRLAQAGGAGSGTTTRSRRKRRGRRRSPSQPTVPRSLSGTKKTPASGSPARPPRRAVAPGRLRSTSRATASTPSNRTSPSPPAAKRWRSGKRSPRSMKTARSPCRRRSGPVAPGCRRRASRLKFRSKNSRACPGSRSTPLARQSSPGSCQPARATSSKATSARPAVAGPARNSLGGDCRGGRTGGRDRSRGQWRRRLARRQNRQSRRAHPGRRLRRRRAAARRASIPAAGAPGQPLGFSVAPSDAWAALGGTSWTFGDGSVGQGTSVTHAYGQPGTYQVTVSSIDALGNVTSATGTVTVTSPQATRRRRRRRAIAAADDPAAAAGAKPKSKPKPPQDRQQTGSRGSSASPRSATARRSWPCTAAARPLLGPRQASLPAHLRDRQIAVQNLGRRLADAADRLGPLRMRLIESARGQRLEVRLEGRGVKAQKVVLGL